MEEKELNDIATLIYRKIQNSNIALYESEAYKGGNYQDKVLNLDLITLDGIKKKIIEHEDMNIYSGNDISSYININLNQYLDKIIFCRKQDVDIWIKGLDITNVNSDLLNYIYSFLDTHLDEDNILMEKEFLIKIGYTDLEKYSNEEIEKIFFDEYFNLKEKNEHIKI